jgi:hypothetical protein
MEVIVTPTAKWAESACASCRSSFDVASPFIGAALLELSRLLPKTVERTLLTRTRLQDFAAGASSLEAVISAAESGFEVRGLDSLHAKVYIFDRRLALVTSANATFSGFRKNRECGVAFEEPRLVESLVDQLRAGFGVPAGPTLWSRDQLASLVPTVARLKKLLPARTKIRLAEADEAPEFDLPRQEAESLLKTSALWTQLVFHGILRLRNREFTTQEVVDSCSPVIASRFPENRHPRQKIRQQLQILRDLGLVTFLTPGRYSLAIRVTANR